MGNTAGFTEEDKEQLKQLLRTREVREAALRCTVECALLKVALETGGTMTQAEASERKHKARRAFVEVLAGAMGVPPFGVGYDEGKAGYIDTMLTAVHALLWLDVVVEKEGGAESA